MPFGAGQIVYEDDYQALIDRVKYQEITTVTVNNSTALVDVPGSLFTVVAGATYWVQTWVAYDGPVAADAKFSWLVSSANVSSDRNIVAPALTIVNNTSILDMIMIRRGNATAQAVGTPAAAANAFTLYHETAIVKSTDPADQTIKMQFAQQVATVGNTLVQSGYMLITRVS